MKKWVPLIVFFFSGIHLIAQENHGAGARALAFSDAYISLSDPWSTFHNQAGLAALESISAAVFYSSKFQVKELAQMAGTAIVPTKSGVFGFSFSQFGTGSYKETKTGLAFAKKLSPRISAGIQFDYLSELFPENKRAKGFVTFEGGIIYKAGNQLSLGAHVFNPLHLGIKTLNGEERMPITFRAGGNYHFYEMVQVCFEIEKSTEADYLVKAGTEFIPAKDMAIRFGVSGKPLAYTAGFGYRVGRLSTDIGFHYHGNLGITPAVSIGYDIK